MQNNKLSSRDPLQGAICSITDLSEEEPGLRDWVERAGRPVETVGVREVTGAGAGDDGRQGLPGHRDLRPPPAHTVLPGTTVVTQVRL